MSYQHSISVVIPAYNAGEFITKTLDSVLFQIVLPDEVIVIDDGSTDDTYQVLKNYSKLNKDLNIKIIRTQNLGPGAARNAGIEMAHSNWIAFLDSDDLWCRNKIKEVRNIISGNKNINFICHNEIHKKINGSFDFVDYESMRFKILPICSQLYIKNIFSTSAVICKKELLNIYGMFDISYRNAQDFELWLRMSPKISLFSLPDYLGVYVNRPGNITSENLSIRLKNVRRALKKHRNKVPFIIYAYSQFRLILSTFKNIINSSKRRI